MFRINLLPIILSLAVAGCAAKPTTLPARDAAPSQATDLSGNWVLVEEGTAARRSTDTLVEVFLEFGKTLKITQTDEGLFISFDRSVVEEYRFGEQREVNVGPIEAQRSSGWDGRSYVIETLDKERTRVEERYRLDAREEALLRTIEIRRGDKQLDRFQQAFSRK